MEDSMIDRPNMSPFDDKTGNKRVRDGEDEPIGRLEKRPSGIIGLNDLEEYSKERADKEGEKQDAGIIDTFISNVFHKNESDQDGDQVKTDEKKDDLILDVNEVNGDQEGKGGGIIDTFISNVFHKNNESDQVKSDALDVVGVDKKDDLILDVNEGKGGGIINALFPNIFPNNQSENGERDQAKSDVRNLVEEKNDELNGEKLEEKKDTSSPELPKKPLDQGNKNQKMKPDDYSERVFFLNNN